MQVSNAFGKFPILPLANKVKPRPNDRNMPSQHIATLLGATCFVRLATVSRCVATNLSQQQPTYRNTVAKRTQHVEPTTANISQHGGQTHTTCFAQQCWDVLRLHDAIVWPGLNILSWKRAYYKTHGERQCYQN